MQSLARVGLSTAVMPCWRWAGAQHPDRDCSNSRKIMTQKLPVHCSLTGNTRGGFGEQGQNASGRTISYFKHLRIYIKQETDKKKKTVKFLKQHLSAFFSAAGWGITFLIEFLCAENIHYLPILLQRSKSKMKTNHTFGQPCLKITHQEHFQWQILSRQTNWREIKKSLWGINM